ncbi:MAG: hypothetical protein PHD05_09250, partial [Sphaerochaetaceae bacterium]|nr:hypothetical protein [Sphaerochaetaceae bacterium]
MATHTKIGKKNALDVNVANDISIEVSDIQIGSVELKDADSDVRGTVVVGSNAVVGDTALVVADANVKASVDAIKSVDGIKKIVDNVNIGDLSAGIQTNDVKVTLDNEEITVNATDLDIRDLSSTTDSVSIEGGNT